MEMFSGSLMLHPSEATTLFEAQDAIQGESVYLLSCASNYRVGKIKEANSVVSSENVPAVQRRYAVIVARYWSEDN